MKINKYICEIVNDASFVHHLEMRVQQVETQLIKMINNSVSIDEVVPYLRLVVEVLKMKRTTMEEQHEVKQEMKEEKKTKRLE